jgi:hypothetical protein
VSPPGASDLSHGVHRCGIDPSIELILPCPQREFDNRGILPESAEHKLMKSITFILSRLIALRQLLGEPVGAHESDACDEFDAPSIASLRNQRCVT